ncbi:MAG: T9SS type A sorting domain-containing protein [Bacteroidetes bacterium]|nr:T9SS type A sorting domain-containing protein [Bacteroidota bacterium]
MKSILPLFLCFTLVSVETYGQCIRGVSSNPDNPYNPRVEGYMAAINNQSHPNDPQITINPWLNTFNWSDTHAVGFKQIPLAQNAGWRIANFTGFIPNMASPYEGGALGYHYLRPPAVNFREGDFYWHEGWELLWLGTGFFPNGEEVNSDNPNRLISHKSSVESASAPYIIIYNRYRGLLRVFISVFTDLGQYDNATIEIHFDTENNDYSSTLPSNLTNLSGTLRHVNSYDQALDVPTNATEMKSQQRMSVSQYKWMSADFQMAFDPCVCHLPSELMFKITAWEEFEVDLYGRAVSLEVPIADGNGNGAYDKGFLSVHDIKDFANDQSGGHLIYHKAELLIADYQARLEKYNNDLKDYQAYNNSILSAGLSAVRDYITWGLVDYGKIASLLSVLGGNLGLSPPDKQFAVPNRLFLPPGGVLSLFEDGRQINDQASKKVSYVRVKNDTAFVQQYSYQSLENSIAKDGKKILASGFDMLSSQIFGKKANKPVQPTTPAATYSEMRFSGSIRDKDEPVRIGPFLNPGSLINSPALTAFNYPAYDEALGLFAMLKSPKLNLLSNPGDDEKKLIVDQIGENDKGASINNFYKREEKTRLVKNETTTIILDEPLAYKLNDALDIKESDVYVMLEFEYSVPIISEVDEVYRSGMIGYSGFPNEFFGIPSPERQVLNFGVECRMGTNMSVKNIFLNGNTREVIVSSKWEPIEDFGELVLQANLDFVFEDYLSFIDVWGPHESSAGPIRVARRFSWKEPQEIEIQSLKLKVLSDFTFEQLDRHGKHNSTAQSFTYLIYDKEQGINRLKSFTKDISPNLAYTPGLLRLRDESLASSKKVHSIHTDQNNVRTYQLKAEEIQIDGYLLTNYPASHSRVNIEAFREIRLLPGATAIPLNTSMKINKHPYNFPPVREQSSAELSAFCNDHTNGYLAFRKLTKDSVYHEAPSIPIEEGLHQKDNPIQVYPNPTKESLNVTFIRGSAFLDVELSDMNGRVFLSERLEGELSQAFQLDFQNISSGLYILKIRNAEGQSYIEQVIKE